MYARKYFQIGCWIGALWTNFALLITFATWSGFVTGDLWKVWASVALAWLSLPSGLGIVGRIRDLIGR
jgi:hypothetical protein